MRTGHLYTSIEKKNSNKSKKTFLTGKDVKNSGKDIKNTKNISTLKYLHENIGNHQLSELLREGVIQPALFTAKSSNIYEIEADRVAKDIGAGMNKKNSTAGTGNAKNTKKVKYTSYGTKGTANISMPKKDPKETVKINKAIKLSKKKQKQIDPVTEKGIKNLPGGSPMDKSLNDILSRRMNYDFGKVKIHSDNPLPGKINAYAFTYGNDIVVGKNAPPKGTKKYNELIAHEATHVVQQNGSKKVPVVQRQEQKSEKKDDFEIGWFLERALSFIGIDVKQFKKILKSAGEVIGLIFSDPGKFFGNLIAAVKGGIGKFMGNIWTHLKNGIMTWLFGSMGGIGITLPAKFDLKGVFSIVSQILNLGYAAMIRGPLAKELGPQGEKILTAAEKGVGIVKDLVEKGPMAMFEHIKDMITSLPGMILDGIIDFVKNTIITRAIAQILLMLNPAGAIVGIIKGIYDVVMFFINNWQRIVEFASAVVNSISEIAKGNVSSAIGWIESALARSIPVLIGFLAQFVGAGNAGKSILGIIKKVKGKIDGFIGKVVTKVANVIKKTPIYKMFTKVTKKVDNVKDKANKKIDDTKKKVENKVDKKLEKGKQTLEARNKAAAEKRKAKAEEKRKKDEEKKKKRLEKQKEKDKKKLERKAKKDAEKKKKKEEKDKKHKKKDDKRQARKKANDQKKQNRKAKKEAKKKEKLDDKDRKKHQKYVDQILKKLGKKIKKKGLTFEEFLQIKKEESASLEVTYQGKVKKGIDVIIKITPQKNSGNIEFDVVIKDNNTTGKTKATFEGVEGVNDDVKQGVEKMHPDAKKYTEDQIVKNIKKDSNFGKKKWAEVKDWLLSLTPFVNILHNKYKVSKINVAPVKSAIKTVLTNKVKGNPDLEKNLDKFEETLYSRTELKVNKTTADKGYSELRSSLLGHAFENQDPTNTAVQTFNNNEKDISELLSDKSDQSREIDEYQMSVKFSKAGGSVHHINQDAAYRDHIPSGVAVTIVLYGNAFTEPGSEHYIVHQQMEIFWDQYRKGGNKYGDIPKNSDVINAMYNALLIAGIDKKTADIAKSKAIAQQNEYGLTLQMDVPRIPKKINQS